MSNKRSPSNDLDVRFPKEKRLKFNSAKETSVASTSSVTPVAEKLDRNPPEPLVGFIGPLTQQKRHWGRLGKAREASPDIQPGLTLVDLPVEIWFEVFEYVDLLDLLRLTRTCKILRRCLMRPSVASVWKRARTNNLDGLPECPPDMDEPSWASLAMDNFCHFCGAKARRPTLWSHRLRMCGHCSEDPAYVRDPPVGLACNPQTLFHLISNHRRYSWKCLVDDVADFEKTVATIGDDDALLETFIRERVDKVKETQTLTYKCELWEHRYRNRLRAQQQKAREQKMKKRRKDIEAKLDEVGYGAHLRKFKKTFPRRFERHPCVGEGGDLTENEWNRIKPTLIELMEEEEKKRRQREHDDSIAQLATLPEFKGKRMSRSMFKALKK